MRPEYEGAYCEATGTTKELAVLRAQASQILEQPENVGIFAISWHTTGLLFRRASPEQTPARSNTRSFANRE
jgi:hypothetical protein